MERASSLVCAAAKPSSANTSAGGEARAHRVGIPEAPSGPEPYLRDNCGKRHLLLALHPPPPSRAHPLTHAKPEGSSPPAEEGRGLSPPPHPPGQVDLSLRKGVQARASPSTAPPPGGGCPQAGLPGRSQGLTCGPKGGLRLC